MTVPDHQSEPEPPGESTGDAAATVTVHRYGHAAVLEVTGEIDMLTAPRLQDAVRRVLEDHPQVLVIDLLPVKFFSSSGLAVLLDAQTRAGDRTRLRVVAGKATLRPLQLTGVDQQLALYPTREIALAGD